MTHTHSFVTLPHPDDRDVFLGVSIRTISYMMQAIAKSASNVWSREPSHRHANMPKFTLRGDIGGMKLSLVYDHDRISIIRKGWSIHMIYGFTSQSGAAIVTLPAHNGLVINALIKDVEIKHSEKFKNDMTKLILFSDNWPK